MSRSRKIRTRVWQKTGGLCWICGEPVSRTGETRDERVSLDHVVRKEDGGTRSIDNLMPSHHKCNLRRGGDMQAEDRRAAILFCGLGLLAALKGEGLLKTEEA